VAPTLSRDYSYPIPLAVGSPSCALPMASTPPVPISMARGHNPAHPLPRIADVGWQGSMQGGDDGEGHGFEAHLLPRARDDIGCSDGRASLLKGGEREIGSPARAVRVQAIRSLGWLFGRLEVSTEVDEAGKITRYQAFPRWIGQCMAPPT
jgi:hypothetical protein